MASGILATVNCQVVHPKPFEQLETQPLADMNHEILNIVH